MTKGYGELYQCFLFMQQSPTSISEKSIHTWLLCAALVVRELALQSRLASNSQIYLPRTLQCWDQSVSATTHCNGFTFTCIWLKCLLSCERLPTPDPSSELHQVISTSLWSLWDGGLELRITVPQILLQRQLLTFLMFPPFNTLCFGDPPTIRSPCYYYES